MAPRSGAGLADRGRARLQLRGGQLHLRLARRHPVDPVELPGRFAEGPAVGPRAGPRVGHRHPQAHAGQRVAAEAGGAALHHVPQVGRHPDGALEAVPAAPGIGRDAPQVVRLGDRPIRGHPDTAQPGPPLRVQLESPGPRLRVAGERHAQQRRRGVGEGARAAVDRAGLRATAEQEGEQDHQSSSGARQASVCGSGAPKATQVKA
ncbi:MAG: hypothetical protein ACK559_26390, partial [bacterium]